MTGYTAPSGTVSSAAGEIEVAWQAFDQVAGTCWRNDGGYGSGVTPQWLAYELASAQTVTAYRWQNIDRAWLNANHPTAWELQGWNGTSWDTLHSVTGLAALAVGEWTATYTVTSPGSYSKYRIYITEWIETDGNWVQIGEVDLQGDPPVEYTVPSGSVVVTGKAPTFTWAPPAAVSWQQVYLLTLTGAADGVADVVIPMESFQCRARRAASTYVGAQVPYTDAIAAAIAARPNGTLVITGGPRFADGTQSLTEIVRADLSRVDTDRGGRNASIALHAYAAAVTRTAQSRTMTGVSYVHTGASNQIRCAVDIWLRPGDTAVDPVTGLEVVAESISYVIGRGAHVMTVSDGNG